MYYVYILQCSDGTLYTGWTDDPDKRVRDHNSSKRGAKYTRSRRPVALKYVEGFRSKGKAMSREAEIKRMNRQEKLSLFAPL